LIINLPFWMELRRSAMVSARFLPAGDHRRDDRPVEEVEGDQHAHDQRQHGLPVFQVHSRPSH
jgi:hypothetical protein